MDNNNNPINPTPAGATQPVAPNGVSGDNQPKPAAPAPGAPVNNLVQDITPASKPAEAAPVAPAAQPTPVAQPATSAQPMQAAAPAQPAMNTNYAQPAPVAQPYGAPKKSHAGLIIGIVVLVLLVLGGIGGFLFYQSHEKTERVIADGLIQFLSAKELTANTTFTVKNTGEDLEETDFETMKFTLVSSKNAKLESSMDATAEIKLHGYDAIKVQGEAMEGENAIYFRVKDTGNLSSFAAKIYADEGGEESVDIKSIFESMFASIGDSWYEIPYDKIDSTGRMKKTVDCVREKASKISEDENIKKITSIYESYPFISVSKDAKIEKVNGYKKYPLTIDEDKAEDFFDKLGDEEFMKEIETCGEEEVETNSRIYDDYDYDDDDYDYGYDDYDDDYTSDVVVEPKEKKDEEKYNVVLGIKPWSHELVWVGFDYEKKSESYYGTNVKLDGEINLSYTSNVATPGDTKSIDELVETVQKSINDSSKKIYYENYCTAEKNYSGYANENDCKQAVDEAFGEEAESGDLEDLLDNLGYLI